MTTVLRLPLNTDDGVFNAEAGPSKFASPAVDPASTLDNVVSAIRQSKRMVIICGERDAARRDSANDRRGRVHCSGHPGLSRSSWSVLQQSVEEGQGADEGFVPYQSAGGEYCPLMWGWDSH